MIYKERSLLYIEWRFNQSRRMDKKNGVNFANQDLTNLNMFNTSNPWNFGKHMVVLKN